MRYQESQMSKVFSSGAPSLQKRQLTQIHDVLKNEYVIFMFFGFFFISCDVKRGFESLPDFANFSHIMRRLF